MQNIINNILGFALTLSLILLLYSCDNNHKVDSGLTIPKNNGMIIDSLGIWLVPQSSINLSPCIPLDSSRIKKGYFKEPLPNECVFLLKNIGNHEYCIPVFEGSFLKIEKATIWLDDTANKYFTTRPDWIYNRSTLILNPGQSCFLYIYDRTFALLKNADTLEISLDIGNISPNENCANPTSKNLNFTYKLEIAKECFLGDINIDTTKN